MNPQERVVDPTLFVGIGASAGGLKACTQFLSAMPAETGMTFVIVMHLDPKGESHMAELLQRSTKMRVIQAQESQRLAPNHVYVIAPSTSLEVRDGILNPSKLGDARGTRKPVDAFFASLARDQQELAVAIVMSGTGDNGSSALADIKATGGLCIVQAPDSADYDGMPQSSIATGIADHVAPPEEMPKLLLQRAQEVGSLRPDKLDALSSESFDLILDMLSRAYRVIFRGTYKRGTLKRRTARRMALQQVDGWQQYLELLQRDDKELAALYRDLLIGVTKFFRDSEVWTHLETVAIPALLERHVGDVPLKIWVPGCATGEEAYGLAMVVLEQLQRLGLSTKLQIFASDVAENALAFARRGLYPSGIKESVSPERLARFFLPRGESYEVCPAIRETVTFALHNLLADPPFSRIDLVSCRNVLIYFEGHAQQKVVELFHFALKPGGLLLLGGSETIGKQGNLFESLSTSAHLYRTTSTNEVIGHHNLHWGSERAVRGVGGMSPPLPQGRKLSRLVEQIVLTRYTWACVAVSESFEIQSFFGPTQDYLVQPTGEARMDLLSWVKPGIYPRLRAALEKARESKERVKIPDLRIERDGVPRRVECSVEPFHPIAEAARLFLVSFRDLPTAPVVSEPLAHSAPAEAFIRQLEDELRDARKELQSTVEQLEITNQEFRTSREELLSLNEELQSNNEELQASKEELQSLNEEMITINRQLEDKNGELRQIGTDLNNLLASASIPIIFLDRELRVRRFTPAATELMRLVPSDLGRSIEHIKERFQDGGLVEQARAVLAKLIPTTAEVQTEPRRWYTRAMRPYRTEDDRIDGVCVTFFDISALKQVARQHEQARRFVEAIVSESPAALLVLDAELRVVTATDSFCALFKVSRVETEGMRLYDLGNGQWNIPRLRRLLEQILPEESAIRDYEVTHEFAELGRRTMRIHAHRMAHGDIQALILLSIEDLTERRTTEQMLTVRASELIKEHEHKNEFLAMLGHELRNPLAALTHGLDLLKLTNGDEARLEKTRAMMERQTLRIVSMLDQLLDLARINSGKVHLARTPVDLMQAIQSAVETTAPLIERRKHQLRLSLPAEVPGTAMVEGDAIRLAQVVENLLSNAAKYTDEGGVIELALEVDERWARIRVRDSGIGMEAELLPHIFELFIQGPRGLERGAGGLGLGLPLVKSLVEMHGGTIDASSPGRGHGSEVLVTLPRLREASPQPRLASEGGPRQAAPGRRYRILLVDDETEMVTILAELLERAGHQTVTVHDGLAAVEALGSFAPEIILLDLGLPGIDGYEVARRLRREPRGEAPLVVAVTGYQADSKRLTEAGFDHHLLKPLSLGKLSDLLAASEDHVPRSESNQPRVV